MEALGRKGKKKTCASPQYKRTHFTQSLFIFQLTLERGREGASAQAGLLVGHLSMCVCVSVREEEDEEADGDLPGF